MKGLLALVVASWLVTGAVLGAAQPPLPPLGPSPVERFRQLLAQEPAGREAWLALRPAPQQEVLRARLAEYEAMPAELREERLRATDLYWHLQQLIRRPAVERAPLIAAARPDLQDILRERLALWDALPESDREVLVQHERAIRYFARVRTVRLPPLPGRGFSAAPPLPARVQMDLTHLQHLTPEERARVQERWTAFFEAPARRTESALRGMKPEERQEMETVLRRFRTLPPTQQQACIASFARFAGLDAAARIEFLRHAERWEALPAEERRAWRDLVGKLPPLPPLPPSRFQPPPLPPGTSDTSANG